MKRSTRFFTGLLAMIVAVSMAGIPAYGAQGSVAASTASEGSREAPPAAEQTVPPASEQPPAADAPVPVSPTTHEPKEAAPLPVSKDADEPSAPKNVTQPKANDVGSVRVQLYQGLAVQRGVALTVELSGPSYQQSRLITFPTDGLAESSASFASLPDGGYQLTVTGDGFATYRQDIQIARSANTVTLYTGSAEFDQEAAHPGIVAYGDVTGDGVIDEADAAALVDAIDARVVAADGTKPAVDARCDLNGDGTVTLDDLLYTAESMGKPAVYSSIERSLPAETVAPHVAQNVQVSGDLSSVIAGNGETAVQLTAPTQITAENPLAIDFDLVSEGSEPPVIGGMTVASPQDSRGGIAQGKVAVDYLDANGNAASMDIPLGQPVVVMSLFRSFAPRAASGSATVGADGTITVDFGGQIAVKKVTFVITATSDAGNLAEISKVEFLNDMESKIPPPEMNVPKGLDAQPGSKEFSVSWKPERNVTGYELSIFDGKKEEVKRTTSTALAIKMFNNDKIKNGTVYTLKVQSVNGTWRSGWSDAVTVVPKTDKVPDAPDGLSVKGAYRGIVASWKKMEDTDSYNLFYREKGTDSYTKVGDIQSASRRIDNLKDNTEYQVYVTGVNEIGEGPRSLVAAASTTNVNPAQLPAYKLVNTKDGEGHYLNHIKSATYGRGSMVDSPLDEASGIKKSALGLFDDNYGSYLKVDDWDEGGTYPGSDKGVTVTFDAPQTIGMLSFAEVEDGVSFKDSNVQYQDEKGQWKTIGSSLQMRTSENGRKYALVKLAHSVTTSKVKLGVGRAYAYQYNVIIAEMRIYAYDSIEHDIMGLYADDLHLVLRDGVTDGTIDALQQRLDTPDPQSGEYYPYRSAMQVELDTARSLYNTTGLIDTVHVHNGISGARDNRNLGIGGLNAWQPLGVVAGAGDEIVVYAGASGKATGTRAPLRLVATQQHPEAGGVSQTVATLKAGRNEITIPQFSSTDVEKGGQLYVEYTGSNANDDWGVRVSGAESVPSLDLYQVTDPAKRLQRVKDYVSKLEDFVPGLPALHDKMKDQGNHSLDYPYDERTCIANATDVMLDQMMYSVPAQQMLRGAGNGSTDERAARLLASFDAMDQMMELFYQHKGLVNSFAPGTSAEVKTLNSLPSRHLNIRYTTMFAGAFMYAAGDHIGIEWDSVAGLGGGSPVVLNEAGAKVSGDYFGWGISHEIGHNINQSQYAIAEITNNYFSQLSVTNETNATDRFSYDDVYQRVTSGDKGRASDVFLQLALYWQLRLIYDDAPAYKLFGTYQDALANRLYARIDSYARDPKTAPKPGGVALTLGGGPEQTLMRLASAAANRDLTEFFTRWGMEPDQTTAAYLAQFSPEERAVYYESDDARAYARSHKDEGAVKDKDVVQASVQLDGSEARLSMNIAPTAAGAVSDSLLGYEVWRRTVAGGKEQRQVVGFTTNGSYTDNASSMSNRVVTYEVCAIDKFLNRSKPVVLDAKKIAGDGLQNKKGWKVSSNMTSPDDVVPPLDNDNPDAPLPEPAVNRVIDGKAETVFTGSASKGDPSLTVDMGKSTEVTSVRLAFPDEQAAGGTWRIEKSDNGKDYTTIKEGALSPGDDHRAQVYFDNGKDPWICTYDARYLRITAVGKGDGAVSLAELDVFGPSGDNVDFLSTGEGTAMGVLDEDFVYEHGAEGKPDQVIPKGSLVFTGAYKGNPAYNVVMLFDDKGKVVGGTNAEGHLVAQQIILAPPPGNAMLGETSDGRWVYWIEPGTDGSLPTLPSSVRAELYRVDNATTNEGQRLVSDTLPASVPDPLPPIHLQGAVTPDPNNQ